MEMLTNVVDKLRNSYNFRGYIHLKAIPGADESLIKKAGTLVDRMSVNLELPSNDSLKLLAPEKNKESIFTPMKSIKNNIILYNDERKKFKSAPLFVPGGQSTQLIVGATKESDYNILKLSENLYNKFSLKRVYYSAYVPVNTDKNLPSIKNPPTLREHRLYQGDWLLRLYGFKADELLDNKAPNFDINFDPKTNWAINNIHLFPVEINKAPYETLIRIPGIGIRGAKKILSSRRISSLDFEDLKKLGVVLKRAQYFITCKGKYFGSVDIDGDKIKKVLSPKVDLNIIDNNYEQLSFFDNNIALSPSFNKLSLLKDKNSSIIGEI